jgi:hypothetical protein
LTAARDLVYCGALDSEATQSRGNKYHGKRRQKNSARKNFQGFVRENPSASSEKEAGGQTFRQEKLALLRAAVKKAHRAPFLAADSG